MKTVRDFFETNNNKVMELWHMSQRILVVGKAMTYENHKIFMENIDKKVYVVQEIESHNLIRLHI